MRLLILFFLVTSWTITWSQNANYEPGQLLVQLVPDSEPNSLIRKFEAQHNIGVHSFEELSDIARIYLLTLSNKAESLDKTERLLYNFPEVQIVQKNHLVTHRETIPNDVLFDELWHLKNTGADGGTVDADIDATDAWDITTGGLTTHDDVIVVCIIEGGGVDINHIDLKDNIWKNTAEIEDDGIDNDGNGYVDDFDGWNVQLENDEVGSGSHGTRVAGMIGAKGNNNIGVTGVNWDVKMMIVKGQQASNEASVIAAYSYPLKMRKLYNETYGEEGAFVVATNASWGRDDAFPEDSPLWCAMYDTLGTYGVLNVGAATNANTNVEVSGDLPTLCTSPYFIGVTMTNSNDVRASSGYGNVSVDLGAPGFGVRLPAPGDSYINTNGTSFAAPCVTGAIALAYSAPCAEFINLAKFDPAAAALEMRSYILDGVDPVATLSDDVVTGGRLNVKNTIDLLMADCDEGSCISPYNMRVVNITDSEAEILWDGFSDNYTLTITEGEMEPVSFLVAGTSWSTDTLKPCTTYSFVIRAHCGTDEISAPSFEVTFRTDGCCINPPVINDLKTENSLTVSWPSILYATQYNLRYAPEGTEDWTVLEDVSSPIMIDELEKCTRYDFQIHTICDDSTRGYSSSYTHRTLGCGACTEADYCAVIPGTHNLEWIDSIQINGYTNGTGANGGWLQSEEIITALTPGASYLLRLVPGYAGTSYTERFSVYIDFNKNGVFDMPEEMVVNDFSTNGPGIQNIFIPDDASIGVTKMRIGMSGLSFPEPCMDEDYFGEYEDYCVYIGPQLSIDENEQQFTIYPNPVNHELFIKTNFQVNQVYIFAQTGQLVYQTENPELATPISTTDLETGVYLVRITTENATFVQKFVKK